MGSRDEKVDSDSDGEINQMKRISDLFSVQITDVNRNLLTVADLHISKRRKEAILSWRKKNPDLISAHAVQEHDDCWAHVHARGLYAVMKQRGRTGNFPTADMLVKKIEKKLLSRDKALPKASDAASLLLKLYKCELVVHHRPKPGSAEDDEKFEKFIARRLAIGPVAMCFEFVPGYAMAVGQKHNVFRPNYVDLAALQYERLDGHCLLITGRGVVFGLRESVEFWEAQETKGPNFGNNGFVRIERYKRLVSEVYEYILKD